MGLMVGDNKRRNLYPKYKREKNGENEGEKRACLGREARQSPATQTVEEAGKQDIQK